VLARFNLLLVFALKMVARTLTNCLKESLDFDFVSFRVGTCQMPKAFYLAKGCT